MAYLKFFILAELIVLPSIGLANPPIFTITPHVNERAQRYRHMNIRTETDVSVQRMINDVQQLKGLLQETLNENQVLSYSYRIQMRNLTTEIQQVERLMQKILDFPPMPLAKRRSENKEKGRKIGLVKATQWQVQQQVSPEDFRKMQIGVRMQMMMSDLQGLKILMGKMVEEDIVPLSDDKAHFLTLRAEMQQLQRSIEKL